MIDNPYEECPPDEPQRTVTIKAKELDNGIWEVYCPEWRCVLHNRNLTLCVADLLAEIQSHNDECRNPGGTEAAFRRETLPKPIKKFGAKRKPIPDDGKRTACDFWQKPC